MIPANKRGPGAWLADRYVRWKMRGAFRGLWVRGELPPAEGPLLAYANHTNFWDGFVAHQLSVALGRAGYCAMEEENLARYRFLSRMGAFSIRRGDARSALESLRYAKRLLEAQRALVFLFPEGQLRPFGMLPITFDRGVAVLARMAKVRSVPVAIRYAFFEHELPDILVDVGRSHAPMPVEVYEERMSQQVLRLSQVASTDGFRKLLGGGKGVAERWDEVRGLEAR